jgi:RNA polymerase sigma-70 factor (ECF subfamily)
VIEYKRTDQAIGEEKGWLAEISRGEEEAFKRLFLRYQAGLLRYLERMLHNLERAEEVFQETMIEVWKKAKSFDGRSSPATWVYSIARHKAMDRLRQEREEPVDPEEFSYIPNTQPDASQIVEQKDLVEKIQKVLKSLSPVHREVIEFTYYQGYSIEEIAKITGCPEGTVKTRMFHARRQLKALLMESGIKEA